MHTLHLRAGRPAPSGVAVASRWLLSAGAVASILEATILPHPDVLEAFVRVLGGDVDHFQQLLNDARSEATEGTTLLHCGPDPHPEQDQDAHPTGPDAVMKTFSKVFLEERTVEDGRARLLHKLAKQQPSTRQAADAQPRPLTAVVDLLRHRPLVHHISPLGTGT
ncbi:hypothetical protein ACPCTK_32420 [Streptomyces pseudogriseolus]|uniref:hypothetical protein n=1 Tax=Streptomyces pseudogriseolus TaxID=36817 RepID=UPI003FA22D8E